MIRVRDVMSAIVPALLRLFPADWKWTGDKVGMSPIGQGRRAFDRPDLLCLVRACQAPARHRRHRKFPAHLPAALPALDDQECFGISVMRKCEERSLLFRSIRITVAEERLGKAPQGMDRILGVVGRPLEGFGTK